MLAFLPLSPPLPPCGIFDTGDRRAGLAAGKRVLNSPQPLSWQERGFVLTRKYVMVNEMWVVSLARETGAARGRVQLAACQRQKSRFSPPDSRLRQAGFELSPTPLLAKEGHCFDKEGADCQRQVGCFLSRGKTGRWVLSCGFWVLQPGLRV